MPIQSAKVRGGLGLIPRRAATSTEIWSRPWPAEAVAARIAADHRPYHAAIADKLAAARKRFGVAVLVDIHSMPSLPEPNPARLVVGDRFGRSAGARFVGRIEGCARRAGITTALNSPYSGGHILERHAAPGKRIHAIQLEFDRALYLDRDRRVPAPVSPRRRHCCATSSTRWRTRRCRWRWPPNKKPPRADARGGQGSGRRHTRRCAVRPRERGDTGRTGTI